MPSILSITFGGKTPNLPFNPQPRGLSRDDPSSVEFSDCWVLILFPPFSISPLGREVPSSANPAAPFSVSAWQGSSFACQSRRGFRPISLFKLESPFVEGKSTLLVDIAFVRRSHAASPPYRLELVGGP